MKKSVFVIGVDLGTESIKAVALGVFGNGSAPSVLGIGGALSRGMRKGMILDTDEAGSAIMEAIESVARSSGMPKRNIYVGVGGMGIGFQKSRGLIAISRADGEVSREDMKRAVLASESNLARLQNREILHRVPLLFKVDNEPPLQDPAGLSGLKLEAEALFVTAQTNSIKSAIKAFESTSIEAEEITASPFLISKAVLEKREMEVGVMSMDLGAHTTSIALFEDGFPYSLEVLPVGSAHITQDIAVGFQIGLDEAEKLKLDFKGFDKFSKKDEMASGKYSKKKLSDIIEARFEDIFELVEKHLKKVDRMGLLPAGVVIVGGGANLPGVEELAKNYLKLPARIGRLQNLTGATELIKNPAWSTVVGIALYGLENSKNPLLRGRSGAFLKWLRTFLP